MALRQAATGAPEEGRDDKRWGAVAGTSGWPGQLIGWIGDTQEAPDEAPSPGESCLGPHKRARQSGSAWATVLVQEDRRWPRHLLSATSVDFSDMWAWGAGRRLGLGVLSLPSFLFAATALLPVTPANAAQRCVPGRGADLAGCNLSGANLTNTNLTGADLNGAILVGTDFTRARLREARLTGANLFGANFSNADLTSARLASADLTGAIFTDATFFDASSGGITEPPASLPTYWTFVNGYLIGPGTNLTDAQLSGANLSDAHLRFGYLTDAKLIDANLTGAELRRAHLTGANLSSANLSDANLIGAHLKGANLTGTRWNKTICPDDTNSNHDGGTCLRHLL